MELNEGLKVELAGGLGVELLALAQQMPKYIVSNSNKTIRPTFDAAGFG